IRRSEIGLLRGLSLGEVEEDITRDNNPQKETDYADPNIFFHFYQPPEFNSKLAYLPENFKPPKWAKKWGRPLSLCRKRTFPPSFHNQNITPLLCETLPNALSRGMIPGDAAKKGTSHRLRGDRWRRQVHPGQASSAEGPGH